MLHGKEGISLPSQHPAEVYYAVVSARTAVRAALPVVVVALDHILQEEVVTAHIVDLDVGCNLDCKHPAFVNYVAYRLVAQRMRPETVFYLQEDAVQGLAWTVDLVSEVVSAVVAPAACGTLLAQLVQVQHVLTQDQSQCSGQWCEQACLRRQRIRVERLVVSHICLASREDDGYSVRRVGVIAACRTRYATQERTINLRFSRKRLYLCNRSYQAVLDILVCLVQVWARSPTRELVFH